MRSVKHRREEGYLLTPPHFHPLYVWHRPSTELWHATDPNRRRLQHGIHGGTRREPHTPVIIRFSISPPHGPQPSPEDTSDNKTWRYIAPYISRRLPCTGGFGHRPCLTFVKAEHCPKMRITERNLYTAYVHCGDLREALVVRSEDSRSFGACSIPIVTASPESPEF